TASRGAVPSSPSGRTPLTSTTTSTSCSSRSATLPAACRTRNASAGEKSTMRPLSASALTDVSADDAVDRALGGKVEPSAGAVRDVHDAARRPVGDADRAHRRAGLVERDPPQAAGVEVAQVDRAAQSLEPPPIPPRVGGGDGR